MYSTVAEAAFPSPDEIFSEIGFPKEPVSDNGSPFQGEEMKQYALHSGFYNRKVTPEESKVNGYVEDPFRNVRKCLQTARIEKKNWKQELNEYL